MANKQLFEMLTSWVKELNKKAFLQHGDGRLGGVYAVATKNDDSSIHCWTSFMTLKELEKVLLMAFNIGDFLKIKEA